MPLATPRGPHVCLLVCLPVGPCSVCLRVSVFLYLFFYFSLLSSLAFSNDCLRLPPSLPVPFPLSPFVSRSVSLSLSLYRSLPLPFHASLFGRRPFLIASSLYLPSPPPNTTSSHHTSFSSERRACRAAKNWCGCCLEARLHLLPGSQSAPKRAGDIE